MNRKLQRPFLCIKSTFSDIQWFQTVSNYPKKPTLSSIHRFDVVMPLNKRSKYCVKQDHKLTWNVNYSSLHKNQNENKLRRKKSQLLKYFSSFSKDNRKKTTTTEIYEWGNSMWIIPNSKCRCEYLVDCVFIFQKNPFEAVVCPVCMSELSVLWFRRWIYFDIDI